MSLLLHLRRSPPGSWIRVIPPGEDGVPQGCVGIETSGGIVHLGPREVIMIASRALRWSAKDFRAPKIEGPAASRAVSDQHPECRCCHVGTPCTCCPVHDMEAADQLGHLPRRK